MKKEQGITLLSLVITIIILILLAGISIHLVLGKNGIIEKLKYAKDTYKEAQEEEANQLAQVDNIVSGSRETNAQKIEDISEGITYNTEYIDISTESTHTKVLKQGNIVQVTFQLILKKDIPINTEIELIYNLPKPKTTTYFGGRSHSAQFAGFCIMNTTIYSFYSSYIIQKSLNGSVMYFSE